MSRKKLQKNYLIGKRLKEFRISKGLTSTQLADKLNITQGFLSSVERGEKSFSQNTLVILKELFSLSLDYLLTGHPALSSDSTLKSSQPPIESSYPLSDNSVLGNQKEGDSMPDLEQINAPIPIKRGKPSMDDGYVYVPRYDIQASAGHGSIIHSEQIVNHLAFEEVWIRQELGLDPAHIVLIKAVGDSMTPTFDAGALLLINKAVNNFKNDSIYVINRDGELIVKRIQDLLNGQLKIKSDNPKYEPLIIQKSEPLNIVGEVVWIGQKN